MILQRLKQPVYQKVLLRSFVVFMVLYTLIMYLMRDRSEPFFTMANYMKATIFSLFMSLMSATVIKPRDHAEEEGEPAPSFRPYGRFFIQTAVFLLVAGLLIFGIGYALFSRSETGLQPQKEALKVMLFAFVFAGLMTGLAWFFERKNKR